MRPNILLFVKNNLKCHHDGRTLSICSLPPDALRGAPGENLSIFMKSVSWQHKPVERTTAAYPEVSVMAIRHTSGTRRGNVGSGR